jgi:excisionase family DNA binding protein
MKFSSGVGVLRYWYDYGEAVKNYSIPTVFVTDDEGASPPFLAPENFDYPDWWYTWVDLDKIIMRLPRSDWALILHYFRFIYKEATGTFYRWEQSERFKDMCERIFDMLDDDEYKTDGWGYRSFERTLQEIKGRVERGEIDVKGIEKGKVYTPQEVADLLRYTPDTIYRLLKARKLEGFKPGKEWRITGEAILALINTDPREVDDE